MSEMKESLEFWKGVNPGWMWYSTIRNRERLFFCIFLVPMNSNEAIEFENMLDGSAPLHSKVVARWQRKLHDKSHQQSVSVLIQH